MTTWAACTFRDEIDVLEIRLGVLGPVVDRFVIAEAEVTHSGAPKSLVFPHHEERFQSWADKLTYVVDDEARFGEWGRENGQRSCLSAAIDADDDDLVLVGDLDEVPDPAAWEELEAIARAGRLAIPRLTMHVLGLRWRWSETWPGGTRLVTGKTFRERFGSDCERLFRTYDHDVQALWDGVADYLYGPVEPPGAGWHFSHLGGVRAVQAKLAAAAHLQFNVAPFNQPDHIKHCLATGEDLLGRPERRQEPAPWGDLPVYVRAHWDRFRFLW